MKNKKRLIDAGKIPYMWQEYKDGKLSDGVTLQSIIDQMPTVDAVVMPAGKPGDYLEWSNGFSKRIFYIRAIIICADGVRYDLGDFAPFVHSCNIVRIMNRKEAEKALGEMKDEC